MKKTAVLVVALLGVFAVLLFAAKPVATICKVKPGSITIDGKVSDWKALGIEPLALNTDAQVAIGKIDWLGAKKQSGNIYVAVDDKNIYVCAVVTNPKGALNKYTGGDIYQGTGIEFFIGFDNSNPEREMYTETDYQIGISTGSGKFKTKPQAYIYNIKKPVKDAKIVCKTTATGYILEAQIPGSNLQGFDTTDGLELGFEVGIDDIGPKGVVRQVQLTWTGDKDGWQFPKGWGKAVIKAK